LARETVPAQASTGFLTQTPRLFPLASNAPVSVPRRYRKLCFLYINHPLMIILYRQIWASRPSVASFAKGEFASGSKKIGFFWKNFAQNPEKKGFLMYLIYNK